MRENSKFGVGNSWTVTDTILRYFSAEDLEITLVTPEETLVLTATNHEQKNEWIVGLQRCVIDTLGQVSGFGPDHHKKKHTPPILRNTSYNFTKLPELKGAKYEGLRIFTFGIINFLDYKK